MCAFLGSLYVEQVFLPNYLGFTLRSSSVNVSAGLRFTSASADGHGWHSAPRSRAILASRFV